MKTLLCRVKRTGQQQLVSARGSALMAAMVVLGVLGILGYTFLGKVTQEQRHTGHWRRSAQAFYLAEAAIGKGIALLREGAITEYPYTENNVSFGSGKYSLTLERIQQQQGAYATDIYTLTGIGTVGSIQRGVQVGLREDTFLRFSRFVQSSSLSYARNATLSGDVWAGVNLNLNGYPVTFMRDVSVGGRIVNRHNGIFYGKVTEHAPPIDLQASVDLNYYRKLARGLIEGKGRGLYSASSSTIHLSQFDFSGNTPTYNGRSLGSDFNGVVFVEGDAYVEGDLDGSSLTIVASDDIIITGHIRTGCTGREYTQTNPPTVFNSAKGKTQVQVVNLDGLIRKDTPVVRIRTAGRKWNKIKGELLEDGEVILTTYLIRQPGSPDEQMATLSNFSPEPDSHSYSVRLSYQSSGKGANPVWIRVYRGEPVNLGLVAKDMIYIASDAPRELVIDAALLARDNSWRALGSKSSHPSGFDGSWVLTINGPIITRVGGSAGPWASYGTRHYNYDEDIVEYQPPHFPVPLGGWKRIFWKELRPKNLS